MYIKITYETQVEYAKKPSMDSVPESQTYRGVFLPV